jgi:signal transduction histidine kinase
LDLAVFSAIVGGAALAVYLLVALTLLRARSEQAALARLAEEAARRAEIEDQLRQSQKLEALGQLTGGIAHDFNNLLSVILGNLTLLRDRPDSTKSRERAANALVAAERGERLVRSLLAFARRQPLTMSVFDLDYAVREIETLLAGALGSERNLVVRLSEDAWPVLADVTQTEMAIINLVVNARDATPKNGTVEIATAKATLRGECGGLVGDFMALSVSDNGTGMPPDVLEHVFEPFFTTKPAGKGSGLGLATIYGFARQCGGSVAIESTPGRGTRVTLYLPRTTRAEPDGESSPVGTPVAEVEPSY